VLSADHRPDGIAVSSLGPRLSYARLGIWDSDEVVALRIARRIIELAVRGERDPGRLKAVARAWVIK
jgi:hypothetical protein